VSFAPGRIEMAIAGEAPRDLAFRFGRTLERATGRKWMVSISARDGGQTLREMRDTARTNRETAAAAHPVVKAVLEQFPGSQIVDIREPDDLVTGQDTETGSSKKA